MFTSEVQFGHAGACANSDRETATAKNKALAEAGAYVPDTFDNLGKSIQYVLNLLKKKIKKEKLHKNVFIYFFYWKIVLYYVLV